jgi:hypothetical protein
MVTWRNRSIDTLSESELRHALDDALNQIAWSRAPDPASFFSALLLGFSAGAVVAAAAAIFTFSVFA